MVGQYTKAAAMAALAVSLAFVPQTAAAADADECGIWLCLPVGFGFPECGDSFEAMLDRLARLKPPLPLLTSCLVDVPDAPSSRGNFTHTTTTEPTCPNGYTLLDEPDLLRETTEVLGDDFGGQGGDLVCVPNNGFGQSVSPSYAKRHTVQVTIDGVTYDSFTFEEP